MMVAWGIVFRIGEIAYHCFSFENEGGVLGVWGFFCNFVGKFLD